MPNVDRQIFAISALWKMLESFSTKGVSVIISIILARLLMPENYGIVALTSTFISISTMLVQSGVNTALIREKSIDDLDYSNAFFFTMTIASVCYMFFFYAAPYIANFYNEAVIAPVLRVQMLSLFLCAIGTIRNAMIVRQFRFKALCVTNLIANIIGGITGVILAYKGFGVWALVFYTLIRDGLCTFLLFFCVKWNLTFTLSFVRIKKLVSFSSWLLLATVFDFCGNNIFNTVFGKHYSMAELGYYNRGMQLPELISLHTFGAITTVMLPAMSNSQHEKERLKNITQKLVSISSYIIFPLMVGLSIIGEKIVVLLFTEKWSLCVPILWAASLNFGVNILRSINMQLIYAVGNSKLGVKIEFVRFIMLICSITIGIGILNFNIYNLAFLSAIIAIIVVLITQYHAKKIIGYLYKEWLHDILPAFFLSIAMSIITLLAGYVRLPSTPLLFFQIFVGVVSYIIFSSLFKVQSFIDILNILSQFLKKRGHGGI